MNDTPRVPNNLKLETMEMFLHDPGCPVDYFLFTSSHHKFISFSIVTKFIPHSPGGVTQISKIYFLVLRVTILNNKLKTQQ